MNVPTHWAGAERVAYITQAGHLMLVWRGRETVTIYDYDADLPYEEESGEVVVLFAIRVLDQHEHALAVFDSKKRYRGMARSYPRSHDRVLSLLSRLGIPHDTGARASTMEAAA